MPEPGPEAGGAVGTAGGGLDYAVPDGPGPVAGATGVGDSGTVGVAEGRPWPVTPIAPGLATPGVGLGAGVSAGVRTGASSACFVPPESAAPAAVADSERGADAARGDACVAFDDELLERRSNANTVARAATATPVAS